MTVERIDRSPLNPTRWCITLTCGHYAWVTSARKPTRTTHPCPERCEKTTKA